MSEGGRQLQHTCKLVERWRIGSISIYIESQTVLTSIAVSSIRIAKEYWPPSSPNWDIIQFLRMLSSIWNTYTHTGSCPGDKFLSRGQNCFVLKTKSCPGDKTVLSLCVWEKIILSRWFTFYIARAQEQDWDCLSGHFFFWLSGTDQADVVLHVICE